MRELWVVMVSVALVAAGAQTGVDADSGIAYRLLTLEGKRVDGVQVAQAPRLVAQCTKTAGGKLKFELLADFGDGPELRFVPPWKPVGNSIFPPAMPRAGMTMEFLGYVKEKPVKRQFAEVDGLQGVWMYTTPGLSSANMEPVTFYLQYLKALPTLRLTLPAAANGGKAATAEFATAGWLGQVKAEPMCAGSGL